jgi:prevent-host-death family protein
MEPPVVVAAEQLERHSSYLLSRVEHDEEHILISRSGVPVAALVPVADAHFAKRFQQVVQRPEALRRLKVVDLAEPLDVEELHARLKLLLVRPRRREGPRRK